MQPRIETLPEKKFIGKKIQMSFSHNKTYELWKSFMPRRKEIENTIGVELYSIEVYPPSYFSNFNPAVNFEKWAAVPVSDASTIPHEMYSLTSPAGLYTIFTHKGPASEGPKTYENIFSTWLPQSEYDLDNRPHFAVMGEKYKHDDADSEEELWIPVKVKS